MSNEESTLPMNIAKKKRGFAAMSPERHRELASRGGRAAQAKGVGHRFSSAEAREAGRAGGRKISEDRAHMSRIGKKGGESSYARKVKNEVQS